MQPFDSLTTHFVRGATSFANSTKVAKTRHSSINLHHYLAKCIEKSPSHQEVYVALCALNLCRTNVLSRNLKRVSSWLYVEREMQRRAWFSHSTSRKF